MFWHKSAFCNLRVSFLHSLLFIASDDKRLTHTAFTLVCQTIRDAMFQTCLVTAMQNQQHSINLTGAAPTSQENTFPTSSHPQPIIYMKTITNEGVVEQEPGTVVPLPSHLAQVRCGGHRSAAPYMGKMGHKSGGSIC